MSLQVLICQRFDNSTFSPNQFHGWSKIVSLKEQFMVFNEMNFILQNKFIFFRSEQVEEESSFLSRVHMKLEVVNLLTLDERHCTCTKSWIDCAGNYLRHVTFGMNCIQGLSF